jgi:hypothetical protein
MSQISIPIGHVTVRIFMDGTEVKKGMRFSSLDSAINFFGWYRLREGNGGGFILTPNSRVLVEDGIQPAFSAVNFYAMDGSHIAPAIVAAAAEQVGADSAAKRWPFRRTFPFNVELPYAFRDGPVPGLRRGFRGRARWLRSPKTTQEIRENSFVDHDEDLKEIGYKQGRRLNYLTLPTRRDDVHRNDQVKSWKHQRTHQWRDEA